MGGGLLKESEVEFRLRALERLTQDLIERLNMDDNCLMIWCDGCFAFFPGDMTVQRGDLNLCWACDEKGKEEAG